MARRAGKGTNPLYQTRSWRYVIRPYWIAQRQPCARCGQAIDYDSATRNAASLNVGHIVGVAEAKRLGWTEAQTNALSNTQPEHRLCSDRSGAVSGNAKRGRTTRIRQAVTLTLNNW